ncbi:hypothetical protein MJL61_23730, partial [Salmonella enterica subsp. enterica serovar Montevideo]|nr:hypothetical protein [Salmonella enterica subsp. enterica serovar Montevideo]
GYTTADAEEAATKKAAMSQAQHVFILADDSKFNKVNFAKMGNLDEAIIITNQINKEVSQELRSQTVIKEVGK